MREQTDAERIECFFKGLEMMEIPDGDERLPAGLLKAPFKALWEALSKQALVQHVDAVLLKLEDPNSIVRHAALAMLCSMGREIVEQHVDAVVSKLADSVGDVRWAALTMLMQLDPAAIAQHAGAIVFGLDDLKRALRFKAALVLIKLEAAVLAQHADAIVLQLHDPHPNVRCQALLALGKMGQAVLVQHASAVLHRLDDTATITVVCPHEKYKPIGMKGVDIVSVGDTVHDVAMRTLHKLPSFVTHEVDFEAANLQYVHDSWVALRGTGTVSASVAGGALRSTGTRCRTVPMARAMHETWRHGIG